MYVCVRALHIQHKRLFVNDNYCISKVSHLNEYAEEDGLRVSAAVDEIATAMSTVGHREEEVVHGELVDAVVLVADTPVVDVALTEPVRHLTVAACQATVTRHLRQHVHDLVGRRVGVGHVQVG